MIDEMRRAERRTFWGIAGDFFFFGVASCFIGQTTVLPTFLASLTGSAPLIGLASTIATGGWLLPQLFAGRRLASLTRRKAAVAIPVAIGRTVFLALGPTMFLLAPRSPAMALAVFYLIYACLWVTDGVASVAWLDLLGGSLSNASRARVISVGNLASGIGGIGAGALIGLIVSSPSLPWPSNYCLLFGVGGATLMLSLASFLCVKEVPSPAAQGTPPWPEYFRRMVEVVRTDRAFGRAVLVQLALSAVGIAAPFYAIHGLEQMGFPTASVGLFTSMQLAGGIAASLAVGALGEKRGTRAVMRAWAGVSIAAPAIAMLTRLIVPLAPGAGLPLYAGVFVIVGMQGVANMAGSLNWVIEYAPVSDRPLYIGFANTLGGLSLVMPLIGGWLLALSGSYPALFAVTAAGPVVALFLLKALPEPRRALPNPLREARQ